MSITLIGHVCRDVVDTGYIAGSGILYGGLALTALNHDINIITKVFFFFKILL
jgi:hypothetical protein